MNVSERMNQSGTKSFVARSASIGLVVMAAVLLLAPGAQGAEPVTLVNDGEARMKIVAGQETQQAERLQQYLQKMSGAELEIADSADAGAGAIYVGTVEDFGDLNLDGAEDLGPEGFILRSDGTNLYLIGEHELGAQHAVTTLLRSLGHRHFFPGETWEVIPELSSIQGGWDERQTPDYRVQRHIWYGFGAYPKARDDRNTWVLHNRAGGPEPISIGHTWYGLDRERDFEQNPEMFALVVREGEEVRHTSKPCYSDPRVIQRMIDYARSRAEAGAESITLSPPDGLNYCQGPRCREVFQGGEPYEAHSSYFAERPDGVLVNITSETLFNAVNKVAEALEEDFPNVTIGCYAYSAYSHPPSFEMHPNVYIQTTTAYRRTPLSFEEQMLAWAKQARQVGVREYWSVYQWDWDGPNPGKLRPDRLRNDIRTYHRDYNVVAMNAESSNNWAPRGLGYYLGAQLMWDIDADVDELLRDFYEKAFGPAAEPMQRYYARWYGPSVVAIEDSSAREIADAEWEYGRGELEASRQTLAAVFADLDEAASLVADQPAYRDRVDHLRMYAYYLALRLNVWEAAASEDNDALLMAIRDETVFGGRLHDTNMIHTRPLIGKAFHRHFSRYRDVWEEDPELQEWNQGLRRIGEVPSHQEVEELWAEARAELGVN